MTEPVLFDVDGGVATLTLNRPESANSLSLEAAHLLIAALDSIAADPDVRVVLLRGNGRVFCAGGDVAAMSESTDREPFLAELAGTAHEAIRRFVALEKVVVAAVQGSAAGAGLSFVLCSDIVLAARSARFLTAYTSVGLTPDCGQSWLLPRVVGLGRALDLTLEPRRLDAEDALDWGIVSHVVEDDELQDQALAAARRVADGPAIALGQARRLLRQGWSTSFDEHLDEEAATIGRMGGTAETGALIEGFVRSHR